MHKIDISPSKHNIRVNVKGPSMLYDPDCGARNVLWRLSGLVHVSKIRKFLLSLPFLSVGFTMKEMKRMIVVDEL